MKKVININFQGRVVPIEETAYDILKQYVESLSRFFAKEEGRDEIINDIEDRIAELFSEILKKGSTCITDEDVNSIIASMGRPEEFEAEEASVKSQLSGESQSAGGGYQSATGDIPRGRLYRDENDKMLGGVCGGLANYLRIDTSLVRILYAILSISSFGTFLLLYILLWIILPSRTLERNLIRKRLFRNPDEKVIAGVASGLAAYFNIQVWVPRLIFAFPLVIGIITSIFKSAFWYYDPFPSIIFGSFGGTLFIVYVILWIVIPEARTASEKLEMKGEKVDLNTIKTTIQEDLSGFRARAEKFGKEVGEKASQIGKEMSDTVGQQTARMSAEFAPAAKKSGNTILQVLGVLIKAFFLVLAGILAFALLMAIIFGSIKGFDFVPLKGYLLEDSWQSFLVWPTIFLFIFLPVIGLIVWIIRRVMKVRSTNHYLGWIFGGLWVIGLVCAILLGTGIARNFSKQVSEKFPVTVTQPTAQTLTVKLGDYPGKYYPYTVFDDDDNDVFMVTKDEDSMLVKRVAVEIAKSDDSLFHVYILKISRGNTVPRAEENMQKIDFTVSQMDSVLSLQKGFAITKDTKFRDQRVAVVIEVPVGKKIMVEESLRWYDWFNIDWDFGRYQRDIAYSKTTYSYNLGHTYIMTTGGLDRLDSEPAEDQAEDQKSREERRREIEEQQRDLDRQKKELEKSDSTYRYTPSGSKTGSTEPAAPAKASAENNNKPAMPFIPGDILMMRFGS